MEYAVTYLSEDHDELRAARNAALARREAAALAMVAADDAIDLDNPNYAEFDAATDAFDAADGELAEIERRLDEIEEDDAFAAAREQGADYYAGRL
jgi:hypothetical protein